MTWCDTIAASAAGIASLDANDPESLAARAHARSCPRCGEALEEADALVVLINEAPPIVHSAGAIARSYEKVAAVLRARDQRRRTIALVGVLVAWGVGLLAAKSRALGLDAWVSSVALVGVSLGVAALAGRRATLAISLALGASTLVATFGASIDEQLLLGHGVKCAAIELFAAAIPYGALVLTGVRWQDPGHRPSFAAAAAAGALAGQAALLVTCPARASSLHLLATHVVGVVLATLLGASGHRALVHRIAR